MNKHKKNTSEKKALGSTVSLKQLSEILGISQTTVSRALNGYGDVSEKTRAQVEKAAKKYGYAPNPLARRLAVGSTETIGFVVPNIDGGFGNHFIGEFLTGVAVALEKTNFDLIVMASSLENGELDTYQRFTDNKRVDGWILTSCQRDDERIRYLQKKKFPFVVFGRTETKNPYAFLDIDNETGAYKTTRRLIEKGHKRIAFLDSSPDFTFAHLRYLGYRRALKEAGIRYSSDLCFRAELDELSAVKECERLLELKSPPTAILCMCFQASRGIRHILKNRNMELGKDISLIVYDDTSWDSIEKQGLTRLTQPMKECGKRSAEILLQVLNGKPVSEFKELWEPIFIEGTTDGNAPG